MSGPAVHGAPRPDARTGRLKVVLYNPQAVFFTMPLALLAIGSELDPERYEVVIVDGRLEADAQARVRERSARCPVPRRHGAHRGADLRCARRSRARRSRHAPTCRSSGAAGTLPCSRANAWRSPAWTSPSAARARRRFAEIVQRLAAGHSLEGCAGCTVRLPDGRIQENPSRPLAPVDSFRAHDYGLIPVERYFELKGKRQLDFISSQGCNFRCAFCSDPFVYGRKWVGLEPNAHGAAVEGALGPLPLRRRQLPGRDLLHQARARAAHSPSASSSPA